ncbi:LacI family DNA-binding transcriptional regulator [Cellulomonas hominis]
MRGVMMCASPTGRADQPGLPTAGPADREETVIVDRAPHAASAPTLRDVAALAGVAVSTASRALTLPGRVNAATADRVRSAADTLGYVASASARALSSGRTGTVALVVADITNPYFFGVVRGTQSRLRASGYVHVLVDTEESVEAEERALLTLRGSVDGVVLAASRMPDDRLEAWARELPTVTLNRAVPAPSVVVDTVGGALQALAHLSGLGHRRVGYAAGPSTSWSDGRRRVALRAAAARAGIELVVLGPYAPRRESGAAAADAALSAGVTGLLTYNDLLAFGVLDRLSDLQVSVPGEISVIGHDDVFGADLVRPTLTTLAVPLERAGYLAADLLLTRIAAEEEAPAGVELATRLVVRESTGPAPERG